FFTAGGAISPGVNISACASSATLRAALFLVARFLAAFLAAFFVAFLAAFLAAFLVARLRGAASAAVDVSSRGRSLFTSSELMAV
ncbi:MAG TPA: hypothetical protein DEA90_12585, partial [Opitutae bacterium]|nr:hypothetical protein [Opitutae bacterium]